MFEVFEFACEYLQFDDKIIKKFPLYHNQTTTGQTTRVHSFSKQYCSNKHFLMLLYPSNVEKGFLLEHHYVHFSAQIILLAVQIFF